MTSKGSHNNPSSSRVKAVASSPAHSTPGGATKSNDGESPESNPGKSAPQDKEKPQKPFRPMNRVPRACNACRKQKMKCTDAENPPCKRCRHAGIECLFEKPIRETMNNSEQGLRIRSLENQVSNIQSTLAELVTSLRAAAPQLTASTTDPATTTTPTPGQLQKSNTQANLTISSSDDASTPYGYPDRTAQTAPSPSLSNQSHLFHTTNGQSELSPNTPINHLPPPHMHPNARQQRSLSSGSSAYPQSVPSPPPQHQGYTNGQIQPQQQYVHGMRPYSRDQQPSPPQMDLGHPRPMYRQHLDATPQSFWNSQGHPIMHGTANPGAVPGGGSHHNHMPAPTSLPPFSQIDVHNQHRGPTHPPAPPYQQPPQNGTYVSNGRSPFMGPLSPRKTTYQLMNQAHYGPPTNPAYNPHGHHAYQPLYPGPPPGGHSREMVSSSNVTSAYTSEEEGDSELPASGMVAPFEAIRGIADVADRVVEENGGESFPPTRSGSPSRPSMIDVEDKVVQDVVAQVHTHGFTRAADSNESVDRPLKRRKVHHRSAGEGNEGLLSRAYPDVVTKNLISEGEARELFNIFFTGCSMFLPVFDPNTDTFDALHQRSPFCVDAICMVAAKVRDGGGAPSRTYLKCLDEVHAISCATLFSPVLRQEVIQAMVIIAGWGAGPKDSGWLTCGHATRMAQEIGMHRAWPRLLKRIRANKCSTSQEERELVISARTWFCLYLFEHQMSFGNGRPAVLREDESIHNARLLLAHPLSINDDMRLVSMLELMTLRERINNILKPAESGPLDSSAFAALRDYQSHFQSWLDDWSFNFAKRYEKAAFHMRSLQCQRDFAELYHNATALRAIRGPEDVKEMPEEQKELARRSMHLAMSGLDVCLRSPSYREGMKYAVQYTHISATFAASFLIRLARLFPQECDLPAILSDVEELAGVLSEIPATRFARTLKLMLRSAKRRKVLPSSRSIDRSHSSSGAPSSGGLPPTQPSPTNLSVSPGTLDTGLFQGPMGQPTMLSLDGLDPFALPFEGMPGDIPMWMGEPGLDDTPVPQRGLEAFLLPPTLEDNPQAIGHEIW